MKKVSRYALVACYLQIRAKVGKYSKQCQEDSSGEWGLVVKIYIKGSQNKNFMAGHKGPTKVSLLIDPWGQINTYRYHFMFLCSIKPTTVLTRMVCNPDLILGPPFREFGYTCIHVDIQDHEYWFFVKNKTFVSREGAPNSQFNIAALLEGPNILACEQTPEELGAL